MQRSVIVRYTMRAFSIFSVPATLAPDSRRRRRHMLARLGLAWLVMMQVMMFAFPGYLRATPMGVEDQRFLDSAIVFMNWISLALTIPVVTYCAWPVWQAAVRRVRQASISMDVPVALGIIAAFIPSVYATYSRHGEVYFDSVTMFVAFLLTARYLELCARQAVGSGPMHDYIERQRIAMSAKADRVAIWFTLIQLLVSFVAGAIWYFYAPERAIGIMVAMLVISCPCAMAMAVPTSVAAAHASLMARPSTSDQELLHLGMACERISRQSLLGAMLWHLLMMPLAAIGWVQPWVAAITMLLSSLAVAANAWRLFRQQTAATSCDVVAVAG